MQLLRIPPPPTLPPPLSRGTGAIRVDYTVLQGVPDLTIFFVASLLTAIIPFRVSFSPFSHSPAY